MKHKFIRNAESKLPLKFKVWIYFVMFTLVVFLLLWVCQILFLENFYERMKVRNTTASAEYLRDSYTNLRDPDYLDLVDNVAKQNDICIEILDKHSRSYHSAEVLGDCIIHGRENKTFIYVQDVVKAENHIYRDMIKNPRSGYDMLLYGCTLGDPERPDGYLLLNTALVPVGSTVDIIKQQLMLITIFLIVAAFFISMYLSARLSAPIDRITKSAEQLAKGNFNTQFDGRGYLESKKTCRYAYLCGKGAFKS